jgi:hypothetical protein
MLRFALLISMLLALPLGLQGAQFALSMPLNSATSAGAASDNALSAFAARNVNRNVNRNQSQCESKRQPQCESKRQS